MRYLIAISTITVILAASGRPPRTSPLYQPSTNTLIRDDESYYNLKGELLRKAKSEASNNIILLTTSTDTMLIDTFLSKKHVIRLPLDTLLSNLDKIYLLAKDCEREYGFIVARSGNVSSIYKGRKKILPAKRRIKCYKELTNKGEKPAYDVHIHPLNLTPIPGRTDSVKVGLPIPSKQDMDAYEDNYYNQPNMVMGYLPNTEKTDYVPWIGFFNKTEREIALIEYSLFKEIVQKLNRLSKKKP